MFKKLNWLEEERRRGVLNTCYFIAVFLRTECAVQLLEGRERERLFVIPPL
jgi:hypothetical protein